MIEGKSCFNCKNSIIDGGEMMSYYSPGYPACLDECKIKEVNDRFNSDLDGIDEETLPQKCGKCEKTMNVPEYSWDMWVSFYEPIPVCSEKCKAALLDEFDKFLMDMRIKNEP